MPKVNYGKLCKLQRNRDRWQSKLFRAAKELQRIVKAMRRQEKIIEQRKTDIRARREARPEVTSEIL